MSTTKYEEYFTEDEVNEGHNAAQVEQMKKWFREQFKTQFFKEAKCDEGPNGFLIKYGNINVTVIIK